MEPIKHEHFYEVADLASIIDQSTHTVTGYVICRTCGKVKGFSCGEALNSPKE